MIVSFRGERREEWYSPCCTVAAAICYAHELWKFSSPRDVRDVFAFAQGTEWFPAGSIETAVPDEVHDHWETRDHRNFYDAVMRSFDVDADAEIATPYVRGKVDFLIFGNGRPVGVAVFDNEVQTVAAALALAQKEGKDVLGVYSNGLTWTLYRIAVPLTVHRCVLRVGLDDDESPGTLVGRLAYVLSEVAAGVFTSSKRRKMTAHDRKLQEAGDEALLDWAHRTGNQDPFEEKYLEANFRAVVSNDEFEGRLLI